MILRQLFDRESSTYTYIVADSLSGDACIIDPVRENIQHYMQLCNELGIRLKLALDTHVHADHVTGLGALKEITGCDTMVGSFGEVSCASRGLHDGACLNVGLLTLRVFYTPGHTSCSYCFYLSHDENSYIFTGDTLLIRGTGRTDFQNGDPGQLFDSLHTILLNLPGDTVVLPGHDYKGWTSSTIEEETHHNPRLQLKSREAFIDHMNKLVLPDPKMMDIAVPANLVCGKLEKKNG